MATMSLISWVVTGLMGGGKAGDWPTSPGRQRRDDPSLAPRADGPVRLSDGRSVYLNGSAARRLPMSTVTAPPESLARRSVRLPSLARLLDHPRAARLLLLPWCGFLFFYGLSAGD